MRRLLVGRPLLRSAACCETFSRTTTCRRCETLEKVGAAYGVTREPIRQPEAKGLRKLSGGTLRNPLASFIGCEGPRAKDEPIVIA